MMKWILFLFLLSTFASADTVPARVIAISGPVTVQGYVGQSGAPWAVTGYLSPTGTTTVAGSLSVSNFPATQNVSGAVAVSGPVSVTFPTIQGVSGYVGLTGTNSVGRTWTLSSITDSVAVTGTVAITGASTISGSVSVSNFPSTQNVSGAVAVSGPVSVTNFPSVQAISGYVGQTGGPWSVSGTVTANQGGTWTFGRTWSLASGTDSVASVQSGTWNLNNISGTISLPTGAATSALQTTGNSSLSSIDTKTPALGKNTMSGSQPVTIASDQTDLPVYQTNASSILSFSASSATPSLLALSGRKGAIGVVTGTWAGSLTWGVSYDGTTCSNQSTYTPALNQFFSTTAANTTVNFSPLVGVEAVCVTPTTISSGTAVVQLIATAAETMLPGPFNFKAGSTASQYGVTVGGTDGTNGRALVLKNAAPASSDYGLVARSLLYDGSANPLASLTTAPSGTEQALVVRPIEESPVDVETFGAGVRTERITQIQADFSQALVNNDVTSTVTGTATVTQASASATLAGSTAVTGSAKLQSNSVLSYTPGHELYALFTAAFTTPTNANSAQTIGIYDTSNGFFVGFVGTTFGVTQRQNGVDTFTAQTSFNGDTLTGTATSMFQRGGVAEALDKTKKNIYRIRYGWLGVAPIKFEILSPDGRWITFHSIRYPNTSVNPHTYSTALPITAEVVKSNSDATNLQISTSSWDAGVTGNYGQDLSYLGTLAALNAALTTNTNGKASVSFNVQSIGTNQLTVEAQNGDLNWKAVTAYTADGISTSAITLNGLYVVPVFGYSQVRIRVSTYASGTTTVASNASVTPSFILTSNADNTLHALINSAATTTIKSGPGLLYRICVTKAAAGLSAAFYDNTAGSGNKIVDLTTGTSTAGFVGSCMDYGGVNFTTGLTVVNGSSSLVMTVTYK
jgi:hypothetical protein